MQEDYRNLIEEPFKAAVEARLLNLISSPMRTNLEFPPFLTKHLRNYVHKLAASKGLESRTCRQDGVKYVKVYKGQCGGLAHLAPTFRLTDLSQKMIFLHLKSDATSMDENTGEHSILQKTRNISAGKAKIPVYRFCAGTLNDDALMPPPKSQNKFMEEHRSKLTLHKYKNTIIETMSNSQVTILCSDSLRGRATEIPQYILEDYSKRGEGCRIICAMSHKATAVLNSEIVSEQRGERLGLTVGYQIQLESMSSVSTNLLYTTGNFFLRCLMGSNRETFMAITHVIIEDISEKEAYGDLLLHEIRQALTAYPHVKLVLMCSNGDVNQLQTYFEDAIVLEMKLKSNEVIVYHLEEIDNFLSSSTKDKSIDYEKRIADSLVDEQLINTVLARCIDAGSEDAFKLFIKLSKERKIDINAQHSQTKVTMGIAAARHDKLNYLKLYISLGGDISRKDVQNKTALTWAREAQNDSCYQLLRDEMVCSLGADDDESLEELCSNRTWNDKDRENVFNIIRYIHSTMGQGSILVLLPSLHETVKQDLLLKQKISEGALPNNIKVYLLHAYTQITEYRLIFETERSESRKVVLATSLPMSSLIINDLVFIVDSGLRCNMICNSIQPGREERVSWISQECAMRRASVTTIDGKSYCFRMYTRMQFELLPLSDEAELNRMVLENICLYAKLLAPHLSIREYLVQVKEDVDLKRIEEAVGLLKEIGAFDEIESITPLGVRLVDIPIDVQLAKVLLFGIALQCLDPVMTIVSMLSYQTASSFLKDIQIRGAQNSDGNSSAAGSDHLFLLRLYQNWIEKCNSNEPLTKHNYVLDADLEIVSVIRAQLIGILRAAGLIQSSGTMNIHFLNNQANCWPLVKAAFAAGMYPNMCRIYPATNDFRLKSFMKVDLHEGSVLRKKSLKSHDADWLLYQSLQANESEELKIICNTLISPVTLALFAGRTWMSHHELETMHEEESDSESEALDSATKLKFSRYTIDEWLDFSLQTEDACLLMEMRQKFYNLFGQVLRVNEDSDKFRKAKAILSHTFNIVEAIASVLYQEEQAYRLPEIKGVGDRPNAFSSKFTKFQEKIATLKNSMMSAANNKVTYIRQDTNSSISKMNFFVKVLSKTQAEYYLEKHPVSNDDPTWMKIILKYRQFPATNAVIFLLLIDVNIFCGVTQLCFDGEKYFLNEICSRNISVNELNEIYIKAGLRTPSSWYDGQQLKFDIGKTLFDMFL